MNEQLPATEETVEQAIRKFAEQKFGRVGLAEGAAELEAIADRAAELEKELAVYKRAEQILREPFGPVCFHHALDEARAKATEGSDE